LVEKEERRFLINLAAKRRNEEIDLLFLSGGALFSRNPEKRRAMVSREKRNPFSADSRQKEGKGRGGVLYRRLQKRRVGRKKRWLQCARGGCSCRRDEYPRKEKKKKLGS